MHLIILFESPLKINSAQRFVIHTDDLLVVRANTHRWKLDIRLALIDDDLGLGSIALNGYVLTSGRNAIVGNCQFGL